MMVKFPLPCPTKFYMRPTRAVAGVIVLLIILGNLWFLTRKRGGDPLAAVGWDSKQEPAKPAQFTKGGRGSWTGGADTPPASGNDRKNNADSHSSSDYSDTISDSSSDELISDEHSSSESNKGESHNAFIYNYGEQPPNYNKGLRQIKKVLDAIADITPGAGPFSPETSYIRDIKSDTQLQEAGELPATSMILGMYLQISNADAEALHRSHSRMMELLPSSVPENAFGGRGVVMTGGGKYFPMVLTAIKWLRETDPDIPVEVFMADNSEYEAQICDNLFPKINVECRVIQEIYGHQLSAKLDSKYALKPLAILASKFDDIYFMDADSYPLTSVSPMFDWSVYEDTGLILNSDYWPRYISPKFYDIVGRKLGGRARGDGNADHALLQSDRENAIPGSSTESGQIYVRKSQHIKSLMLAMYYNLFGPDVYFPLLMQNGHGEGDKDTYAAAAVICDEKYYQTSQRPVTLGQHRADGNYRGFAMAQPNPKIDYDRNELGLDTPKQMFALHANSIKSNPKYLLMDREDPIRGAPMLRQQRFFGNMDNVRKEMLSNEDVEERLFRVMSDVACEWAVADGYVPRDWDDQDPKRLCKVLKAHTKWLQENPDMGHSDSAPYWYDLEKKGTI